MISARLFSVSESSGSGLPIESDLPFSSGAAAAYDSSGSFSGEVLGSNMILSGFSISGKLDSLGWLNDYGFGGISTMKLLRLLLGLVISSYSVVSYLTVRSSLFVSYVTFYFFFVVVTFAGFLRISAFSKEILGSFERASFMMLYSISMSFF